MPNSFQGKKGGDIGNPRIVEVFPVTPGFLKTAVADAIQIFFKAGAGGFTTSADSWKGGDDSNIGYAKKIDLKIESYANDLTYLQDLCLLSTGAGTAMKDLVGQIHVFAKDENGNFYNFIQLPDLQDWVTTPGCSTAMTPAGTKFVNSEKERKYSYNLSGWLTDAQMQYLKTSMSAYIAAGAAVTGGVTCALVIPTSSRAARVLPPGYHTCKWTPTGGAASDFGILDSMSFEAELVGGPLQMNKQVVRQLRYTIKGRTKALTAAQLAAASENSNLDGTLQLLSYAGETINVVGARGAFEIHGLGNDFGYIEVDMTGLASITACDFSVANALTITMNNG